MEKCSIAEHYNVSLFLREHFSDFYNPLNNANNISVQKSKSFLTDMFNRGYIRIEDVSLLQRDEKSIFDNDFPVFLTLSGLDYLQQYRVIQSTILSSEIAEKNYNAQLIGLKSQEKANLRTYLLSGLTVLITLATLGFTIYQTVLVNKVEQQLTPLKEKVKTLELKQNYLPNQIASPEVPVHKQ